MKKSSIIITLILLPLLAFAGLEIGPTMQYKIPISSASQIPGKDSLSINDFSFGADARLTLSLLQFSGYGLVTPGDSTIHQSTSAKIYTDGGICINLAIIRLGAGIGPNFIYIFKTNSNNMQVNGNIRFAGDVVLGNVALSLVYLIEANLSPSGVHTAFQDVHGQLGLSALFKVF